ncbi:MAG: hypothetical protein CBE47_01230 [Pelagibacteraceae bacterium TMED287]|nr:MAG: hypothetical protein CBE47_01230 [Pelagibacteraceae bacterium TMED287]|tara:strand:+ start:452 stop:1450 length:999 start_codon:yes stop_codon:yes gene_type:complete
MNLIKTISIQTIVLLVTFEFFSFVLTNFNLLIFNEKPIYFKKNYDGEIWRSSNLEIGPWHNISVSTRHVKTCFDVSYSSNNIGARDNKNYFPKTFEKSIVLIGDSFAEGYGVKLDKTFSKLIEKKLKKNVINLGSSGSDPEHNYLRFEKFAKGKKFAEIVYLFFPLNDFIDKENSNKKKDKKANYARVSFEKLRDFLSNFTYSFNTIRTVKFLILNKDKSFSNQSYQYKNKESIDYTFSFINKVMSSENKKKTLIIIPAKKDMRFNQSDKNYKNLYWFQELESMSQKLDFELIDLNDVFNIKNVNEYFHSCDGHWSKYGNFAAAEHFLNGRK